MSLLKASLRLSKPGVAIGGSLLKMRKRKGRLYSIGKPRSISRRRVRFFKD